MNAEQESPTLQSPVRLGPHVLTNRMVMAPMTRSRADDGNVPTELMALYYAQRASAGLIITEATQVSLQGVGYPATPGIHTDQQVAGWRGVVDAVHAAGGRIFLQLWHVGRISLARFQPGGALPVAPSAIAAEGTHQGEPFPVPRALALDELPGIVDQFRDGAKRALDAGFDGVEVHGANGYLLDQFLSDGSNHRTDAYGGSVANRARLLLEVTDAVIEVWGSDRVGVRLSPTGTFNSIHDSDRAALHGFTVSALDQRSLAYLHIIDPQPGHGMFNAKAPRLGRLLRDRFQGPLMINGGFDRPAGDQALTSGRADLVAFGVPFLANPDLPQRFALDATLNTPDPATFYGGDEKGFTDYPALDPASDSTQNLNSSHDNRRSAVSI